MKLCFKLLLFAGFCLVFLDGNASKDSVNGQIIDEQSELYADEMVFDGTVEATQDGKNIMLSGRGKINLTLAYGTLTFEVCKDCAANSTICYEADSGISSGLKCSGFPSYCNFQVKNDETGRYPAIWLGKERIFKDRFDGACLQATLHQGRVIVNHLNEFESCEPKVNGTNKMIKLFIDIDPRCRISCKLFGHFFSKYAKVHVPEILTTSTKIPSNDPSTETASFPWWAVLIIVVGVVLALLVIGFIAYYLYKKRQTSKADAAKMVDGRKLKAIVPQTNVVTIGTPTKKEPDLEDVKAKPENKPEKNQKKVKKTTQEQETTEDAPAPSVEPPTQPSKQQEPEIKTPYPCYPEVKRLIPRSMKSAKTDSLDETLKKDKTAMIEPMVVSFGHHCLKSAESDVMDEMKHNYPSVQHDVLQCEIQLLCAPVSKMYAEIDSLSRESEQKLTASGCEFDDQRRLISIPKGARRYLTDKKTAATTVYFAFGAEYSRHLSADSEVLEKASVPLLYVIALQPRFPVENRRKACAILRRKLCKILGYYKASDRAKMPFPVNIVEEAYGKNPKYFFNPSGIKTDSEGDRRKKEAENGDGKRKKKSSKKRH